MRVSSAVLVCLACAANAFASLGGTVASVEADRVQTQSALVRIQRAGGYSVHELQSPTGTAIREYYGADGVVFGVAWDGEWTPDLRQLFGAYFAPFERASVAARRAHKMRGQVAIDDNGLIVHATGHARSSSGIAYVPALMPAGVSPDVVK
jgi:Protein of unknown function (DUF2844)